MLNGLISSVHLHSFFISSTALKQNYTSEPFYVTRPWAIVPVANTTLPWIHLLFAYFSSVSSIDSACAVNVSSTLCAEYIPIGELYCCGINTLTRPLPVAGGCHCWCDGCWRLICSIVAERGGGKPSTPAAGSATSIYILISLCTCRTLSYYLHHTHLLAIRSCNVLIHSYKLPETRRLHSIECKLTPATRSPEICFCTS